MEPQMFEMLRDRFDQQDATLKRIENLVTSHVQEDEVYWKKVDRVSTQVGMVKYLLGVPGVGGFLLWMWQKFSP